MLIKVFSIWLVAANVAYLKPEGNGCRAYMTGTGFSFYNERYITFEDTTCDAVAKEINIWQRANNK